jgi:ATP-dependent Clp protease adaptor protein ClpS
MAEASEPEVAVAEPAEKTQAAQPDTKRKPLPPYVVVLHNDDLNTVDFVISVLRKVFNYDRPKAVQLTFQAHHAGRAPVWTGNLEVAELRADQIRSCGPDPVMKSRGAGVLRVTVEPLPQ